jgi:ElaB/YqjD/DUF883 family membrane-anchored ribosome-binding protein
VKNRWKLVAGTLLLALVLAACGGGDDNESGDSGTTGTTATTGATSTTGDTGSTGGTVSPEEYVKTVCTSMSTWVNDVQTMSNDFTTNLDPSADLQTQKDAIVQLFDDMLGATDTLISSLQSAGTPDVDNGDQIQAALSDSFEQARTALNDAKTQVEKLGIDDPAAFATELGNIGTAIQSSMSGITGSLGGLQAPELEQAAAQEPACQAIAGGGATSTT